MSRQQLAVLGLSPAEAPLDDAPIRFLRCVGDGFGERGLLINPRGVPAWELLRLRSDFTVRGVIEALRWRVRTLSEVNDVALPRVRVSGGDGARVLICASYTNARPLDELTLPRSAAFALVIIRDVARALALLHDRGVTHGALSARRIRVTEAGHLIVCDHLLGGVLERLALSRSRLWTDLGVLSASHRHNAPFRLDLAHLAAVALGILLGRAIRPAEFPDGLKALVNQHVVHRPLQHWLHQTADMDHGFSSAGSAVEALEAIDSAGPAVEVEIRSALADFARQRSPARTESTVKPFGFGRIADNEAGTVFIVGQSARLLAGAESEMTRLAALLTWPDGSGQRPHLRHRFGCSDDAHGAPRADEGPPD